MGFVFLFAALFLAAFFVSTCYGAALWLSFAVLAVMSGVATFFYRRKKSVVFFALSRVPALCMAMALVFLLILQAVALLPYFFSGNVFKFFTVFLGLFVPFSMVLLVGAGFLFYMRVFNRAMLGGAVALIVSFVSIFVLCAAVPIGVGTAVCALVVKGVMPASFKWQCVAVPDAGFAVEYRLTHPFLSEHDMRVRLLKNGAAFGLACDTGGFRDFKVSKLKDGRFLLENSGTMHMVDKYLVDTAAGSVFAVFGDKAYPIPEGEEHFIDGVGGSVDDDKMYFSFYKTKLGDGNGKNIKGVSLGDALNGAKPFGEIFGYRFFPERLEVDGIRDTSAAP